MKKNVIFFVIDSLSYERLTDINSRKTVPFFRRLMSENVSYSNMYSQAPYTEAALMGLICGASTMNHNSYMMRYRDVPETFLETFAKNGYDVYQIMQPHIYPSSLERNLPNSYYNVGFDFNALWSYRLSYFADLNSKNLLNDRDYRELEDLLMDNFKGWILFLQRMQKKDASVSLILGNLTEYDVETIQDSVEVEFSKFKEQPKQYIIDLLNEGKSHALFKIPTLNQDRKVQDQELKKVFIERYVPLFQEIADKQKKCDVRLNGETVRVLCNALRNFIHFPTKENAKIIYRFLRYVKERREPRLVMERISEQYDAYKSAPSVQKHMDHFFSWLDKRDNAQNPYLAYIHVDDIHNPEVFFTYDSENLEMLEEEMADAQAYVEGISSDYTGSLTYDLALQYMDKKLENFMRQIEDRGMLEDTVIYVTADHGFSFYNHPLRETVPNNFYKESYHVPFIIINNELPCESISDYHSTMDIPATILSEAGLALPSHFNGKSALHSKRDYVTMEYMGGGCPDFYRRPIRYALRNSKISLVYSVMLNDKFENGILEQYFDLDKDPLEQHNLVLKKKLLPRDIDVLLDPIRRRHDELREYYNVK